MLDKEYHAGVYRHLYGQQAPDDFASFFVEIHFEMRY